MLENMVAEYHVELAVGKRNPLNVHLDLRQRGLQIGRHVIERRQLLETLQETTLGRDMQQTGRRLEESGLVLQIEPHQPVTLECQTTGTQRVPARIHIAVRHKASIMRTADRTLHAAPRIGETQHRRAQMHHPLDIPSRDMPQYESDQSFHGRRHYSSFKASDTSCSALAQLLTAQPDQLGGALDLRPQLVYVHLPVVELFEDSLHFLDGLRVS